MARRSPTTRRKAEEDLEWRRALRPKAAGPPLHPHPPQHPPTQAEVQLQADYDFARLLQKAEE
eukprot:107807-Heterocapsa_arctica.AAC.1